MRDIGKIPGEKRVVVTPEAKLHIMTTVEKLVELMRKDQVGRIGQIEALGQFAKAVLMKNEVMNLTAITEAKEFYSKHICDSLSLATLLPECGLEQPKVLDLGSGAGFPGIPLKIIRPDLEVMLMDSLNKRVNFLNETVEDLGLNGIHAIHGRAEELGRIKRYREQFDFVTARAVASLPVLLEYCLPFVKIGGFFLAMKSQEDEIRQCEKALKILGGKLFDLKRYALPLDMGERVIFVVRKIQACPAAYPRKAGTPNKIPLM